jgi:hypothetical protein
VVGTVERGRTSGFGGGEYEAKVGGLTIASGRTMGDLRDDLRHWREEIGKPENAGEREDYLESVAGLDGAESPGRLPEGMPAEARAVATPDPAHGGVRLPEGYLIDSAAKAAGVEAARRWLRENGYTWNRRRHSWDPPGYEGPAGA